VQAGPYSPLNLCVSDACCAGRDDGWDKCGQLVGEVGYDTTNTTVRTCVPEANCGHTVGYDLSVFGLDDDFGYMFTRCGGDIVG